jgi:hypothetical protein
VRREEAREREEEGAREKGEESQNQRGKDDKTMSIILFIKSCRLQ